MQLRFEHRGEFYYIPISADMVMGAMFFHEHGIYFGQVRTIIDLMESGF